MKTIYSKLFSMPLMLVFMLLFFISVGGATIVESWYGTPVAQNWVYKSTWFSVIIIYLSFSLVHNMIRFKLFQTKKISSLLFHLAFLVIILGAGVTRYFGFEGVMMIREGQASNQIISTETFLQIKAHNNVEQYTAEVPVSIDTNAIAYVSEDLVWNNPFSFMFNHNNYFEHSFDFKEKQVKISCVDVLKNPKDTLIPDVAGEPYVELVTGGMGGRTYHYVKSGGVGVFDSGLKVSFNNPTYTEAINIMETDSGLYVQSPYDLSYMQMSDTSQGVIVRDSLQEFLTKRLYVVGEEQFAFNQYYLGAIEKTISSDNSMSGLLGLTLKIDDGTNQKEILLKGGKGQLPRPEYVQVGDLYYELSFGSKIVETPFSIQLNNFELERYPGTNNPSSFSSTVTVLDPAENVKKDHHIFMNNVLDYGGYRFFQSSYDEDEMGTILSVNKDAPGSWITYIGYFLLGLGFVVNMVSRKSRFRMLMKKARELRTKREAMATLVLLIGMSFSGFSQDEKVLTVVDEEHADKFAHLIIQDFGGRFEPVHTLAHELMLKIHRGTEYKGQNAMQIFLGLHVNPIQWLQEPIIYVSGKSLQEKYNVEGKHAALVDFLGTEFEYLLYEEAEIARLKRPAERSQYDKDVLKTDERFNILSGVFNGFYLRIFPKPNDSTNAWYSPYDSQMRFKEDDSVFVSGVMKLYFAGVNKGIETGNWKDANKVVDLISTYQQKTSDVNILPSSIKIEWEIWYNELNLFKRLMTGYITIALILLILQFFQIFWTKIDLKWPIRIASWVFGAMWVSHGVGLGLRWYLSGHAPWSNGYEAVVFIAFVTILAGLLFIRQSKIVLGATGILAWLMLFVAHMNQMDPEMTQLVPVLKSYWLMIHVAVITGSYGFLGLGAILGLMTIIMNLFLNESNSKKILVITKELTYVSEMTITIGLFMLTIGTFLGGVWANESWGRYWGWDAKETWALASVLIYAVLLHMRFVPGLKSQFAFNAASLWAYGSIIMTFFGVNYYLSGLHSYAQGDPMPVPTWVPVTVWSLLALTLISFFRWKAAQKRIVKQKDITEVE